MKHALAVALLAIACGPKVPQGAGRPEILDERPAWMTRGEEVRIEVAEQLLDQGNTLGTLEILRAMRQEGYDSGEVDLLQGRALRMEGLVAESEQLLVKASDKLKKDARPHTELCILLADDGRLDEAITHCEQATEHDPQSGQSWNNLGFLYLSAGRTEDALVACGTAVQLDSTHALFRNNLAIAQAATGRHEAAFQTYQSTVPKAIAAFNVGAALERFDHPDQALVYYERAVSIDPTHADAVEARARLAAQPAPSSTTPSPGETP